MTREQRRLAQIARATAFAERVAAGQSRKAVAYREGLSAERVGQLVGMVTGGRVTPSPEWSEEMKSRLRELWSAGHSTAEIGRRLGVSKDAVIGKAHRMHLPSRPSPIRWSAA